MQLNCWFQQFVFIIRLARIFLLYASNVVHFFGIHLWSVLYCVSLVIHIYIYEKVLLHIAIFDGWLSECYRSLAFHRNKLFSTFSGIENLWICTIQAMTTSFQTVIHHLVLNLWVLRSNEGYYICKKVDALLVYSLLYTVLHWSCFDVAICVKAMSPFNCIPVGV